MTIETCRFVTGSELFDGLKELWDKFSDSDPDFSWGGNDRTLVDPVAILNHLDNSVIDNEKQVQTLRRRVGKLPKDVYVDLET